MKQVAGNAAFPLYKMGEKNKKTKQIRMKKERASETAKPSAYK